MAFCKNCGAELAEDQKFCANCGATLEESPVAVEEPVVAEAPVAEEPKKAGLNVGMLVWSIIGLVVCCSPFSIPALIMTILAINMPVAEAEKKIKLAKTFNIISIVWGVLYFTLCFIVGFLAGLAEALAFML
ncbi:MAG: zinc-ribbon domain-containing protein [Clostridia bacterium]|nr:zinc-ribbon domain-containing protein [Clostridia bacterium]MBR2613636.1 zinc-ribbon domain-containing protein [Clostridia bacterium]